MHSQKKTTQGQKKEEMGVSGDVKVKYNTKYLFLWKIK